MPASQNIPKTQKNNMAEPQTNLTIFGSMLRYSPMPAHTPPRSLFLVERYSALCFSILSNVNTS